MRRRFTVEMNGTWQHEEFVLDESFVYDTGETEHRTWRVIPGDTGRFTARCSDCVGVARGECGLDSIRMAYAFRLRLASRSIVVDFDDRLYRMRNGTAINRATMRKWGVKLGELSLFYKRAEVP